VTDFRTILLLAVARARVGLIGHNDLMNKRLVELAPKEDIGGLQLRRLLTLLVDYLEFHVASLSL
jgi:hypothetical protein